jgi:DNA-binding transcriptional LysR family regulator
MEIDDIRAFVTVADAGSISRAASELYLTQPAVTRRLQRLESACGTPLVDRRQRPFSLTTAGAAILERCRDVLVTVTELRGSATQASAPAGEVNVGVAHALTDAVLVEPVEQMQQRFPGVALRIQSGWSREILDKVRGRTLDAGLLLLPQGDPLPSGVTGAALASESIVVVARRGAAARRRLRDLAGTSWVLSPGGCAARATLLRLLRRGRADGAVAVETYTYALQMALVARGRGLGFVPSRLLAASPWRRRLQVVRVEGLDVRMTIWSVRGHCASAIAPAVDTLEQAVSARLAPARHQKLSHK